MVAHSATSSRSITSAQCECSTVFVRMDAAATIIFKSERRGVYSRAATFVMGVGCKLLAGSQGKGSGFSCARPFLVNAGGVVGKDGGEIVLHRDVPWHPL